MPGGGSAFLVCRHFTLYRHRPRSNSSAVPAVGFPWTHSMADAPTITIPDTQGTQEIVPESQWAGCRQPDSQEPTTQVVEMPEASVAPIEAAKLTDGT